MVRVLVVEDERKILRGLERGLGAEGYEVLAASSGQVVGLRRLSEQEYRNSIADIFGKDIAVQGMFEPQIRMNGLIATSTPSPGLSVSSESSARKRTPLSSSTNTA